MGSSYKLKLRSCKEKEYKHQLFSLEDKRTGEDFDFLLYNDQDVPFLKKNVPENQVILTNIIDGDMDDDC